MAFAPEPPIAKMLGACVDVWEDLYGRESEESKGTSKTTNDRSFGKDDGGKATGYSGFGSKDNGQEDDGWQT